MIKFFRKIRYDLMDKNKTGKYLKYALGEIILVVIGILIALSINNWNENQKSNNKSYNYLERLNDDIEMSLKEVDYFIEDNERKQKNSILVMDALESHELPAEQQENFSSYLRQYYQFQIVIQNFNTFNEMMSAGELGLINNQQLRSAFANLASTREFIMEVNQSHHNAYKINNDLFQKHVRYQVNETDNDSTVINSIYDFETMAEDRLFINKISDQSYTWFLILNMYQDYKSKLNQVKDTIQLELKKYN
ncbi:MAG: hypothetical protein ACI9AT_000251 [Ulvibacter sp.]|jgi:hypothetical protein